MPLDLGHNSALPLPGRCLVPKINQPYLTAGLGRSPQGTSQIRLDQPVEHGIMRDLAVDYLMDENNVLFYGVKGGELYVFDAETDELNSLGPIEPALKTLLDEWEAIRKESRDD